MMESKSALENSFLIAWLNAHPFIIPERQYRWHPERMYRADFAFVEERVLVEIQGTRSLKSRHLTPNGYHQDAIRMCEAQIMGWKILYIDSMFDKEWRTAVNIVERALGLE